MEYQLLEDILIYDYIRKYKCTTCSFCQDINTNSNICKCKFKGKEEYNYYMNMLLLNDECDKWKEAKFEHVRKQFHILEDTFNKNNN